VLKVSESALVNTTTTTSRSYLYSSESHNYLGSSRSLTFAACTELGAYQAAQPEGKPSLLSRQIQPDYTQQWCTMAFPAGKYNSIPSNGPDLSYYNHYGDLNISAMNLALIDGGT
jgi:hypothetical protein